MHTCLRRPVETRRSLVLDADPKGKQASFSARRSREDHGEAQFGASRRVRSTTARRAILSFSVVLRRSPCFSVLKTCLLDCGCGEGPHTGQCREQRPPAAVGRGSSRWFSCGQRAALGVPRASALICVECLLASTMPQSSAPLNNYRASLTTLVLAFRGSEGGDAQARRHMQSGHYTAAHYSRRVSRGTRCSAGGGQTPKV